MTLTIHTRQAAPAKPNPLRPPAFGWPARVRHWWHSLGWRAGDLPETLRADVEPGHHPARPSRGRADWERRL